MSKALSDIWHKTGYLEIVCSEILEVRECREATQGMLTAEKFRGELGTISPQADPESLYEWKETKPIRLLEWLRPKVLLVYYTVLQIVVGRDGVAKMGDSGNAPRVTGHEARLECVS